MEQWGRVRLHDLWTRLHEHRPVRLLRWKLGYYWHPVVLFDALGHTIHAPAVIQDRLCHRFDVWTGLYNDDDDLQIR